MNIVRSLDIVQFLLTDVPEKEVYNTITFLFPSNDSQ